MCVCVCVCVYVPHLLDTLIMYMTDMLTDSPLSSSWEAERPGVKRERGGRERRERAREKEK